MAKEPTNTGYFYNIQKNGPIAMVMRPSFPVVFYTKILTSDFPDIFQSVRNLFQKYKTVNQFPLKTVTDIWGHIWTRIEDQYFFMGILRFFREAPEQEMARRSAVIYSAS